MFEKKLEAIKMATSGSSVKIECRATGTPVISYKWFKDEIEVSCSTKYTMAVTDSVASLEVVDCSVEDCGDYVCVASSEAGSDRCCCTMTVEGWFHFDFFLHLFSLTKSIDGYIWFDSEGYAFDKVLSCVVEFAHKASIFF